MKFQNQVRIGKVFGANLNSGFRDVFAEESFAQASWFSLVSL